MSIKQAIEALELAQDALDISQSLQESAKSNHHPKTLAAYERVSSALAALRSMPQGEPVDDAMNTLCKMMHSGEEVESDDGLAMLVPMDLWNEAQEAIELLVGEDDATEAKPAQDAVDAERWRFYLSTMPEGDHAEANASIDAAISAKKVGAV